MTNDLVSVKSSALSLRNFKIDISICIIEIAINISYNLCTINTIFTMQMYKLYTQYVVVLVYDKYNTCDIIK